VYRGTQKEEKERDWDEPRRQLEGAQREITRLEIDLRHPFHFDIQLRNLHRECREAKNQRDEASRRVGQLEALVALHDGAMDVVVADRDRTDARLARRSQLLPPEHVPPRGIFDGALSASTSLQRATQTFSVQAESSRARAVVPRLQMQTRNLHGVVLEQNEEIAQAMAGA
jgi:hypothetical protein